MYRPLVYSKNVQKAQKGKSSTFMLQIDCDPRELEGFAEKFKQRRIKLGVTQADVGVYIIILIVCL